MCNEGNFQINVKDRNWETNMEPSVWRIALGGSGESASAASLPKKPACSKRKPFLPSFYSGAPLLTTDSCSSFSCSASTS